MTITQLQKRLSRVMSDLEEISMDLYDRGFGRDWNLIADAEEKVSEVCGGFLDEEALRQLSVIIFRPTPGEPKRPVVVKAKKRAA